LSLPHKESTIDVNRFAVNEIVLNKEPYGRGDVIGMAILFKRIPLTPGLDLLRR
jgi:hypothetical protein